LIYFSTAIGLTPDGSVKHPVAVLNIRWQC